MHSACRFTFVLAVVGTLAGHSSSQAGSKGDLYEDAVLQGLELTFKQANYWQLLHDNRVKKIYIKADLRHDGKLYRDVGVRFRGNSSWLGVVGKDKKPFKISMDEFVPGQRLKGYRTINLNNNFLDPSMMREPLSYWVLRKFMPASGCNFAKLSINGKNWGLYVNAQQINSDFLPQWFDDTDGVRYRGEWIDGEKDQTKTGLTWLGSNNTSYQRFYQIKTESAPDPWTPLVRMIDKLNNSGSAIAVNLPKELDVDGAIRYVVGCNLLPLHDSYTHFVAHNYWMYRDPKHSRFHIIPWDLNNSLGCYPFQSTAQSINLDPFYKSNKPEYPLVQRILANPDWKKRYAAHFRRILREGYDLSILKPKLDQWRRLLDTEMRNDPKKLYNYQMWVDSFTKDVKAEIWVPGLEPFIAARANFLRGHWELKPEAADIAYGGMNPTKPNDRPLAWAGVSNPAKVKRVSCYWRTIGAWNRTDMFDDGLHGDKGAGDGIYAVSLPQQQSGTKISYYFEAENHASAGGAYGYRPAYGSHQPKSMRIEWARAKSPIQIHELLAINATGAQDQQGEREDWIELCNTSTAPQPIGGLYLTDDMDRPTKWQIPSGYLLPPGGVLLFWADNEPNEGKLHTNFKLSGNGETLALFARDGFTILDSITFGVQRADHSVGRVEDRAESPWVSFGTPSPAQLNAFKVCGARSYDAFEASDHPLRLELQGTPRANGFSTLALYNAPANAWILASYAADPGSIRLPQSMGNLSLLFRSPILASASGRADARGELKSLLSFPPSSAGIRMCVQIFALQSNGTLLGSNGLEIRPCK